MAIERMLDTELLREPFSKSMAIAKINDLFTTRHPGEGRGPEVPRPVD